MGPSCFTAGLFLPKVCNNDWPRAALPSPAPPPRRVPRAPQHARGRAPLAPWPRRPPPRRGAARASLNVRHSLTPSGQPSALPRWNARNHEHMRGSTPLEHPSHARGAKSVGWRATQAREGQAAPLVLEALSIPERLFFWPSASAAHSPGLAPWIHATIHRARYDTAAFQRNRRHNPHAGINQPPLRLRDQLCTAAAERRAGKDGAAGRPARDASPLSATRCTHVPKGTARASARALCVPWGRV